MQAVPGSAPVTVIPVGVPTTSPVSEIQQGILKALDIKYMIFFHVVFTTSQSRYGLKFWIISSSFFLK